MDVDRFEIVLSHERASRDAPDFLPALQKDLLEVVGRYVEIREDMLRVSIGKSGDTSLLEINVEIDGAKLKPAKKEAVTNPRPIPTVRFEPEAAAPWVKPG